MRTPPADAAPELVRPRLVLVTTMLADGHAGETMLRAALSGGDVASVILDPAGRNADAFQDFAERLVPIVQDHGAAAIIADDTRCAGRVGADGIHVSGGDLTGLAEAIQRFSPKLIVGTSGFGTRHDALEAGERLPDYVMFGRLGGDTGAAARDEDLDMAEWWAEIVELPCIVLGGHNLETLAETAGTGAEFVALSRAIFASPEKVAASVARANAVFDAVLVGPVL